MITSIPVVLFRYHNDTQKAEAEAAIAAYSASHGGATVYTDLLPLSEWTDAEDYHQVWRVWGLSVNADKKCGLGLPRQGQAWGGGV